MTKNLHTLNVKILSPKPWVTEKLKRPSRRHRSGCLGFILRIVEIMFPRPKSCYKHGAEIVGEAKISQRRVDLTTGISSTIGCTSLCRSTTTPSPAPVMLLSKRSNSLQNLNTVRCKERKVDFKYPVKLAWVQRAHSQDSNNGSHTTKTDEHSDSMANEWCDVRSYSSRQEQQKRKSLDIFLARSFIDPTDLFPTSCDLSRRQKAFVKPVASFNEDATTLDSDWTSEDIWPRENGVTPTASVAVSCRGEKRVRFAGEVHFEPQKLSAQAKRLNFRNSRVKFFKVQCSYPSLFDSYGSQNSVTNLASRSPEVAVCSSQGQKCLASNSSKDNDCVMEANVCQSPATNSIPALATTSRLSSTTSSPSLTTKRKLKSCRSRSFHKSLNGSSFIGNGETSSYIRKTKPNSADVVTVVSLLTSREEIETAEASATSVGSFDDIKPETVAQTTASASNTKNIAENLIKPQIREIRTKSGILKVKPCLSKCVSLIEPLPVKSMLRISEKSGPSVDFRPLHENNLRLEHVTVASSKQMTEAKSNFSASVEVLDCAGQSQKEKECWSSFNKMTNKGLFVSFDTILRGLLTPTEYRLRKSDLLKQN